MTSGGGSTGSYRDEGSGRASPEAERLARQAAIVWGREREALEALGLAPGAALLDVGCGTGAPLARVIAGFAPRLAVGVDRSAAHLARARAIAPVVHADGARLPYATGTFDAVVMRFVLRHAPSPRALIDEAARVLRPGGRLFAIDADDDSLLLDAAPPRWPALLAALKETARRHGGDPTIGRSLKRLLAGAGLEDLRARVVPVSTEDLDAPAFVEVFLAPAARPIDDTVMPADDVRAAWGEVAAWARRPDAFAVALGFFVSGRTRVP
jgi:SAM-dependent methyltransferase